MDAQDILHLFISRKKKKVVHHQHTKGYHIAISIIILQLWFSILQIADVHAAPCCRGEPQVPPGGRDHPCSWHREIRINTSSWIHEHLRCRTLR